MCVQPLTAPFTPEPHFPSPNISSSFFSSHGLPSPSPRFARDLCTRHVDKRPSPLRGSSDLWTAAPTNALPPSPSVRVRETR
jgi:hypothetical protein